MALLVSDLGGSDSVTSYIGKEGRDAFKTFACDLDAYLRACEGNVSPAPLPPKWPVVREPLMLILREFYFKTPKATAALVRSLLRLYIDKFDRLLHFYATVGETGQPLPKPSAANKMFYNDPVACGASYYVENGPHNAVQPVYMGTSSGSVDVDEENVACRKTVCWCSARVVPCLLDWCVLMPEPTYFSPAGHECHQRWQHRRGYHALC